MRKKYDNLINIKGTSCFIQFLIAIKFDLLYSSQYRTQNSGY